jgi:hypothetical protein
MRLFPELFLDRRSDSRWSYWRYLRQVLTRHPYSPGVRLTKKRLLNLWLSRYEMLTVSERVWSLPIRLNVEPINACNLRCPGCHTGVRDVGRSGGVMSPDLYRRLLAELGEYLFLVDFHNWAEGLLSKNIDTMIREAVAYGIATSTSTNLSFPFNEARAERLVSSGLHVLGVSIDGAQQETYEKYRRGGDLDLVLENCRRIAAVKRRLGSDTPHLIWGFHAFSHNEHDVPHARALAKEIGMEFAVCKGWVVGPDWVPTVLPELDYQAKWFPMPCDFLWQRAVVNNDGGVAPCCATFARSDDMGRITITPEELGSRTFREVWNGERFREARRLFRGKREKPAGRNVCTACPVRLNFVEYLEHHGAGLPYESFQPMAKPNEGFNYFWNWTKAQLVAGNGGQSGPSKHA